MNEKTGKYIKCKICRKEFWVFKSRFNKRKYCSRECSILGMIGRCNKPKNGKIIKCKECNKNFYIPKYRINKQKFCSAICRKKFEINQGEYINCKKCGKKFWVQKRRKNTAKFCSYECMEERIYRKCLNCNKKFYIHKSRIDTNRGKFCSKKCYTKYNIKENHPCWRGGISFEPYGLEFNLKLKLKIRQRDNFICQECKKSEKKLKQKLSIHHIDYNKKNNNLNNLISLCKKCHAKTNFKRNDWINYFQIKILKIYKLN